MVRAPWVVGSILAAALIAGPTAAYATTGHGGGHTPKQVCHNGKTLTVDDNALKGHLKHGDKEGPCQSTPTSPTTATPTSPSTTPSDGTTPSTTPTPTIPASAPDTLPQESPDVSSPPTVTPATSTTTDPPMETTGTVSSKSLAMTGTDEQRLIVGIIFGAFLLLAGGTALWYNKKNK